jgi:outer membrane protein TolC
MFLLLGTSNLIAQTKEDSLFTSHTNLVKLPTLISLIDSAVNRSPVVKLHQNQINQSRLMVQLVKTNWAESIKFNSNYVYGTSIENVTQPLNNNPTQWFGVGTSVSVPLADILNRKEQIQIANLEIGKDVERLNTVYDNIKLEVISGYSAVQLNSKILIHREEALSVCIMQLSYADLEFKNGSIEIADFSRIHDSYVLAVIAYEESRDSYLNALINLEVLTGVKLR